MNVELGKLPNGTMVVVTDTPFPHMVKRIEFYKDQKLVMLVYDDPEHEGDLMDYELTDQASECISGSPSMHILTAVPGEELRGYDVPLVTVH